MDDLRWKAPRDPDPWKGTLEADNFGSECTQYGITGLVKGSEDCLYLNVWRPQSDDDDLPVYFWIHGGGNSMGAASDKGYDGANLARNCNMVVVTVNYRLGPLGWFTCKALRSGEPGAELDASGKSVIPGECGSKLGACHGMDVPFFFGNWDFFDVLSGWVFG